MPIAREEQEGVLGFQRIWDEMGPVVKVETGKLIISEFNTRCRFINEGQVKKLMASINEKGFIPRCAVWVNAITEDGAREGKILQYRLVAGRHRHESATRLGMEKIPCQILYNLKPEEECELDRVDNELDESHEPVHFLEEAEHYRYLAEVKGWSQRVIAKTKGVSRANVQWKLRVAKIPEEAKAIIRGGQHAVHFMEKHFENICRLSDPHIITICSEIAERGLQVERGEKDRTGRPLQPMKHSEIKQRVQELLELEKEGKTLKKIKEPLMVQQTLFKLDEEEGEPEDLSGNGYRFKTVIEEEEPAREPELAPPPPTPIPKLPDGLAFRSPEKNIRGMNFDRCVRWLKLTGVWKEIGWTSYVVLKKLLEYDLWFRGNQDEPFYFSSEFYGDPIELIANQAGVEREHLQRRAFPALKELGFLDYWTERGEYRFKLNWDALFELYQRKAYGIPFKEDGLKGIPGDFSGILRPTPFHHISIQGGGVVRHESENKPPERAMEDSLALALKNLKPSMDPKGIAFCLTRREETEISLKLLDAMPSEKRREIKNEAAYVLELVRRGPQIPQGFQTPQELLKQNELDAFAREFQKRSYRYFIPDGQLQHEITMVCDQGFAIHNEGRQESFCFFRDWMDWKFFR